MDNQVSKSAEQVADAQKLTIDRVIYLLNEWGYPEARRRFIELRSAMSAQTASAASPVAGVSREKVYWDYIGALRLAYPENPLALNVAKEVHDILAQPSAEGDGWIADGVSLITAERKRQVESEGWTPEHDDAHTVSESVSPEGAAEPSPEVGQVWRAPNGTQYRVIQFLGTPGRWLFQCVSDRTLGTATLDSTWELIPQPPAPEAAAAGDEATAYALAMLDNLRHNVGEQRKRLDSAAPIAPAADELIQELVDALKGVMPYMEQVETAGLVGHEGCHWPVEFVRAALARAEDYRKGAKNG